MLNPSFFITQQLNSQSDKIISLSDEEKWNLSAIYSFLSENNQNIKIADIEIFGKINKIPSPKEESIFNQNLTPIPPTTFIYPMEEKDNLIFKINHAGYIMGSPIKFGKLLTTDIDIYLDLDKIVPMHMAVLGTTGSGKTTFIRRFLENINEERIKIYIFDIYQEYSKVLNVDNKNILAFKDSLFPIDIGDIKELLKNSGIDLQERSREEKAIFNLFRKYIKPDLDLIGFNQKNLKEIIEEASTIRFLERDIKEQILDFISMLIKDYSEEAITSQKENIELIRKSLDATEKFIIYDLKNINNIESRINIVGLILKEIFRKAQLTKEKSLIILEEAHNFAPEKGFGEIQTGRENLAFIMAKKIATEGRKFNLGLVAITQRPANINKYVLSQLNTQVIFKLINKNDLDAVSVFFESNKEDIFDLLPFLKPGSCFITGLAVPFGILAKIKLG